MSKLLSDFFEDCFSTDPCSDNIQLIAKLPTCRGVLFFTDAQDLPVLLVTTANIRSYVRNRLFGQQQTAQSKKAKLAEVVRKIYCCRCYCDFKSTLRHYQIASALYPDNYRDLVTLAKLWYVTINLKAKWPCFSVTNKPFYSDTFRAFGPLPTRKSAAEFIRILTESFALCQQPSLISSPEKAAACPYLQMQTCPGPCVGKIRRSEYLQQINAAIDTATYGPGNRIKILQNDMQRLSEQMKFEQAHILKKQINSLELLEKDTFQWTTALSRLTVLHIDRSAKITSPGKRKKTRTYSAFFIKSGHITEFADFTIKEADNFSNRFLSQLTQPIDPVNPQQLSEHLALLGYYLYRISSPGIWIDCSAAHQVPTAEEIKEKIRKQFESPA